jgi:hypothetical protein
MNTKSIQEIDQNFKSAELGDREYEFHSPLEAPFEISGLPWLKENNCKFCRLPQKILPDCNEGVQHLAWHTSGVSVRFKTDSKFIAISAELLDALIMSHMPVSGRSGFDLYLGTGRHKKFWKNIYPELHKTSMAKPIAEDLPGEMTECEIYLPLYNGVKEMHIGLCPGAKIEPPAKHSIEKPILFYGSSITQGGCASRPGNSYSNIVSRNLDANSINLGFSGSAKGEALMAETIASLDLSLFVLDYDHNAPTKEHLIETHEKFFRIFREFRHETPVLIASKCDFDKNPKANDERRAIIRKSYENAIASGDKNVYFLDGEWMFGNTNRDSCTVDGCHPNDLGFMRMAETFTPVIDDILNG